MADASIRISAPHWYCNHWVTKIVMHQRSKILAYQSVNSQAKKEATFSDQSHNVQNYKHHKNDTKATTNVEFFCLWCVFSGSRSSWSHYFLLWLCCFSFYLYSRLFYTCHITPLFSKFYHHITNNVRKKDAFYQHIFLSFFLLSFSVFFTSDAVASTTPTSSIILLLIAILQELFPAWPSFFPGSKFLRLVVPTQINLRRTTNVPFNVIDVTLLPVY